MKHTPGPWTASKSGAGVRYVTIDNGAEHIAHVAGREDGEDNAARNLEADANARLIAAAPELLAALVLLESWHDIALNMAEPPHRKAYTEDVEQARAAIAKATEAAQCG